MTTEDITIAIRFEAVDIALEIQETEEKLEKLESERDKDTLKAQTYEIIIDLIYGGKQE